MGWVPAWADGRYFNDRVWLLPEPPSRRRLRLLCCCCASTSWRTSRDTAPASSFDIIEQPSTSRLHGTDDFSVAWLYSPLFRRHVVWCTTTPTTYEQIYLLPFSLTRGLWTIYSLTIIGVCYCTLLGQSSMIFCTIFPTVNRGGGSF